MAGGESSRGLVCSVWLAGWLAVWLKSVFVACSSLFKEKNKRKRLHLVEYLTTHSLVDFDCTVE